MARNTRIPSIRARCPGALPGCTRLQRLPPPPATPSEPTNLDDTATACTLAWLNALVVTDATAPRYVT